MAEAPEEPSLLWRTGSSTVMGLVGALFRSFLYGASTVETHGLESFKDLLDRRRVPCNRERGLITVSNHMSILDDPLIWGILPFGFHFNPSNHRWSLASHDICFQNKVTSLFFTFGQTLPTHRLNHSTHGGLFQPTMTQAVRLMSRPPFSHPSTYPQHTSTPPPKPEPSLHSPSVSDPFSSPTSTYTYTTNGTDTFPAPSAYPSRQHSWIHIFPEGKIHQHPSKTMRYFKWGIARLILEPEVCPDIIPMWIDGTQNMMHESREFPRFIPRPGKQVGIWFGVNVGGGEENKSGRVFHELRQRWQQLVKKSEDALGKGKAVVSMGVLSDELKYGEEAVRLREECTVEIRNEVLKVRRMAGLPDEDPKQGLVETWAVEGSLGKREGKMQDGSWVKDT